MEIVISVLQVNCQFENKGIVLCFFFGWGVIYLFIFVLLFLLLLSFLSPPFFSHSYFLSFIFLSSLTSFLLPLCFFNPFFFISSTFILLSDIILSSLLLCHTPYYPLLFPPYHSISLCVCLSLLFPTSTF